MTSLIGKALSLFGLMPVSEHEALAARFSEMSLARCDVASELSATEAILITRENELAAMTAKFKKAVADLEKQAGEIADWRTALERMEGDRDNWRDQALRDEPDALAMRRKIQRDRELKAAKAAGKVQP